MYDPRGSELMTAVQDPTPEALHREAYYNAHRAAKPAAKPASSRPAMDAGLLRAQLFSRLGHYLRVA